MFLPPALVPLALGTFLLSMAMVKDMKRVLHNVNRYAKVEGSSARLMNLLFEFVQYHSNIKQLSVTDVMNLMRILNFFLRFDLFTLD